MKCPYRTITKNENNMTYTDFAECYYSDCPWYKPETPVNKNLSLISFETCQRCHMENQKVMNDYNCYKR